jgi:hypothetical protein
MCGEVSKLALNDCDIRAQIPVDLLVVHNKAKYLPFCYEMRFKNGEYCEIAILRDLKANSVLHVPLEKIKKYIDLEVKK